MALLSKMKFLLLFILTMSVMIGCNDDSDTQDCSVQGRWIIDGLEESTLYEFTEDLRYTIYSTTAGEFGTIADAIPNPNDYSYDEDSLIIDLNFGNFSRSQPVFRCDCNVMDLSPDQTGSVLYKEGHDLTECN